MFGRYRSYTSYSEENGILVPSKEPLEKDVKLTDNLIVISLEATIKIIDKTLKEEISIEKTSKEKLKSDINKVELINPRKND